MDPKQVDQLFCEAVSYIDAGDLTALERLLATNSDIAWERLDTPGPWISAKFGGKLPDFFKRPYLLWFVAEDPVRTGRLPQNIDRIAETIIGHVRRGNPASLQEQLDYALRLVSWSTVAREYKVQVPLIDVLVDAGASLNGNPNNALVNRNVEAAEHLVRRGGELTLATALCLQRWEDVPRLAEAASASQRQFAFVLAALNGKADALTRMIQIGVDVNGPSQDLYPHGTPLHHAVCSGNLEAVRTLVDAGANLQAQDTAWHGTPLGWALYYVQETKGDDAKRRYEEIADYLRRRASTG